MTKQWAEPSWSSWTNLAHQARSGSGQDLNPTHHPLSLIPHLMHRAPPGLLCDVAAAALLWPIADQTPAPARWDLGLPRHALQLLLLDLFLRVSLVRPQNLETLVAGG
jgi:hypothetical protein